MKSEDSNLILQVDPHSSSSVRVLVYRFYLRGPRAECGQPAM